MFTGRHAAMRGTRCSEQKIVRVCLIEENPLAACELRRMLRGDRHIRVVSYRKALKLRTVKRSRPVFVVDRGTLLQPLAQCLRQVQQYVLEPKAIVLDRACPDKELLNLVAIGINGFLPYRDVQRKLPAAIRAVAGDHLWIPRQVVEQYVRCSSGALRSKKHNGNALTHREQQVLELLRQKLLNKQISAALGISESTVKFHLSNIFAKLGVRERASAAVADLAHSPFSEAN